MDHKKIKLSLSLSHASDKVHCLWCSDLELGEVNHIVLFQASS